MIEKILRHCKIPLILLCVVVTEFKFWHEQEVVGIVFLVYSFLILVASLICQLVLRWESLSMLLRGVGFIVSSIFLVLNFSEVGALVVTVGVLLNCIVMTANHGKMPVGFLSTRDLPEKKRLNGYVSSLDTQVRLGFLGDRLALMGFSPGDLVLLAGLLWMDVEGLVWLLHS